MTSRIVGGILYPEDADVDPYEYVRAVAELAEARGARIAEHTPVVRLHGAHRIEAVETAGSTIRPELVVLAAGAWTPRLLPGARHGLLVEAGRGFSLTYDVGSAVFERPLRLGEIRTIVRSVGDKVRVTSKLDLVGLDEGDRRAAGQVGRRRAEQYVELPAGVAEAPAWAGLRPLAPDGLPYIGPHAGGVERDRRDRPRPLGISLAAVTGEAVAGIVSGDGAPFDLERVRPDRFR